MFLSGRKSLLASPCRRLARIPTAFHLWCAERELRIADTQTLSFALRHARARNLDLLRQYRLRGEFPHNRHDPTRFAPCFIDAAGRQCAVAFLMSASGAEKATLKIARSANHARIGDMQFTELETWANGSGLTKAELARIQPGYANYEEVSRYADIIFTVWFLGALSVNSILFNCCRLIWAHTPRLTTMLVGLVFGIVLLYVGFRIDVRQFDHGGWWLQRRVQTYQTYAFAIGILSVICAVIPLFVRPGWLRRRAHASSEPEGFSDASAKTPNEHVKAANPGHYQSVDPAKQSPEERIRQMDNHIVK